MQTILIAIGKSKRTMPSARSSSTYLRQKIRTTGLLDLRHRVVIALFSLRMHILPETLDCKREEKRHQYNNLITLQSSHSSLESHSGCKTHTTVLGTINLSVQFRSPEIKSQFKEREKESPLLS